MRLFRSSLARLLAFLLPLALGSCDKSPTPPAEEPATITGMVSAEGEPLAGVTVTLSGPVTGSTTTSTSGSFEFTDLAPGTYEVRVGNLPADVVIGDPDRTVILTSGGTGTATFEATYVRTAAIDGTVRVDGEGVSGAPVRLTGRESRETTTDAGGRYRFAQLRAGSYTVTLGDLGDDVTVEDSEHDVVLDPGEQATADFAGVRDIPVTVSVPYVEKPGGSLRFNPAAVSGEADVIVLVEAGSHTVTEVRLFLDDTQVASEAFEAGDITETAKLEIRVNTAEFDDESGDPLFANGVVVVRAEVDTEEGGANVAFATLEIGLANDNRIAGISAVSVGDGVVSQGRRWYGARDLTFQVVPVIYDPAQAIGAVTVRASGDPSANGGPSLDLGSGLGVDHRVEGPPFTFTASLEDNAGHVEDDPEGRGHTIRVVRVFDSEGVDVTGRFIPGRTQDLSALYIDFVGPQVGGGSQIRVGGVAPAGQWFSDGAFSVTSLTETGAGGVEIAYEVDDAEEDDPLAGIASVAALEEGGAARYSISVASIVDMMGNRTAEADLPPPTAAFGVDRTPVVITEILPAEPIVLNTNAAAGKLSFFAEEPLLADGAAGSGYDGTTVVATDEDGDVSPTGGVNPNASGANTIDVGPLDEREWTIVATTKDGATPANQTVFSYSVVVDRTGPVATVTNPPPSAVGVGGGSASFTISGTVTDASGISEVLVTARNADGGLGIPGLCEVSDPLFPQGTGPGEVTANTVDVTSMVTSSQVGAFSATFQFHNPAPGSQQNVCLFIEAADVATDRDGDEEPNTGSTSTKTTITWS